MTRQEEFEQNYEAIQAHIRSIIRVAHTDERNELIQEATCHAWTIFRLQRAKGRTIDEASKTCAAIGAKRALGGDPFVPSKGSGCYHVQEQEQLSIDPTARPDESLVELLDAVPRGLRRIAAILATGECVDDAFADKYSYDYSELSRLRNVPALREAHRMSLRPSQR